MVKKTKPLVDDTDPRPDEVFEKAAEVFRDTVVSRLATGGGDVKSRMTPLRPATIERKGHSRIGVDSRTLIKDVTSADITVTGARMPKR